mgnify:FL=1
MRMKHKPWAEPYLAAHPDIVLSPSEITSDRGKTFLHFAPLYLEIGTGKGDFIVGMAQKNPDAYFLGIEKSSTALAITAKKVAEAQLTNVMLLNDDALLILDLFPEQTMSAIFLNFSDPWPKKKHSKRRLTNEKVLETYFRLLKKLGKIYLKTDNQGLFEFSYENFSRMGYGILEYSHDYDGLDAFDYPTEYETKFRSQNIPINRLIVQKGEHTHETDTASTKAL